MILSSSSFIPHSELSFQLFRCLSKVAGATRSAHSIYHTYGRLCVVGVRLFMAILLHVVWRSLDCVGNWGGALHSLQGLDCSDQCVAPGFSQYGSSLPFYQPLAPPLRSPRRHRPGTGRSDARVRGVRIRKQRWSLLCPRPRASLRQTEAAAGRSVGPPSRSRLPAASSRYRPCVTVWIAPAAPGRGGRAHRFAAAQLQGGDGQCQTASQSRYALRCTESPPCVHFLTTSLPPTSAEMSSAKRYSPQSSCPHSRQNLSLSPTALPHWGQNLSRASSSALASAMKSSSCLLASLVLVRNSSMMSLTC